MITRLNDIPFERLISCEWIIITHKLGDYLFQNDECFKQQTHQINKMRWKYRL